MLVKDLSVPPHPCDNVDDGAQAAAWEKEKKGRKPKFPKRQILYVVYSKIQKLAETREPDDDVGPSIIVSLLLPVHLSFSGTGYR